MGEVEGNAHLGAHPDHAGEDLLGARRAAELLLHRVGPRLALRRRVGLQLERPPAHVNPEAGPLRQRLLQAALPDIAPGAHDVGVDVNGNHIVGVGVHVVLILSRWLVHSLVIVRGRASARL